MASCAAFAVAAPRSFNMFDRLGPVGGGVVLLILIMSLGVHEAAHAWVAALRGDTTAKDMGRMTLDPRPHIDPVMTILLPLLMMMTTPFMFGGAKPVPVIYSRLKSPLRDMMLVALAGPASNLLLAIFFAAIRGVVMNYSPQNDPTMLTPQVLWYAVMFNLLLAIFNMVPVPPLDGSRVMAWLLPDSLRAGYVGLERFGLLIVMMLILTPVFRIILGATMPGVWSLVNAITLGGAGYAPRF